ncbi:hypothetical protein [Pedobacter sp. MR22-3]|uniref:hypothetical protein n=1 Tax=Pedobacter sp. MR22-3 TaxID=2994552 RepID=UPI0022453F9B|nr:hypothetical protein [Pedobacter sp. MR22-3]
MIMLIALKTMNSVRVVSWFDFVSTIGVGMMRRLIAPKILFTNAVTKRNNKILDQII